MKQVTRVNLRKGPRRDDEKGIGREMKGGRRE